MRAVLIVLLGVLSGSALAEVTAKTKILFDTDFAMPPTDDALALMLALQSPEVEIIGVSTVAGNYSLERATSDVLRMLEIAGRPDIPVYRGAELPLVHRKSDFAVRSYGEWYSDDAPPEPPGGFAAKRAESESAASFIAKSVMSHPGELTIVAVGPLTNIAQAMSLEPALVSNVGRLVIMGGAIASLPDGAGNITPNAEFNFWVDPEAAHVVLRSGMTIELSPLNVSRQARLDAQWFRKITATDTPLTQLLRDTMEARFQREPDKIWLMYDQIAVASLIDPGVVLSREMYVDVDARPGISYGTSVGGDKVWPGAEGSARMQVQYQLDWPRFIELFAKRVSAPVPAGR